MRRDQEIFDLIEQEHQRQLKGMELIASENFVSDEVTNMPRVIPASATMAVARWWTRWRTSPSTA